MGITVLNCLPTRWEALGLPGRPAAAPCRWRWRRPAPRRGPPRSPRPRSARSSRTGGWCWVGGEGDAECARSRPSHTGPYGKPDPTVPPAARTLSLLHPQRAGDRRRDSHRPGETGAPGQREAHPGSPPYKLRGSSARKGANHPAGGGGPVEYGKLSLRFKSPRHPHTNATSKSPPSPLSLHAASWPEQRSERALCPGACGHAPQRRGQEQRALLLRGPRCLREPAEATPVGAGSPPHSRQVSGHSHPRPPAPSRGSRRPTPLSPGRPWGPPSLPRPRPCERGSSPPEQAATGLCPESSPLAPLLPTCSPYLLKSST